MVQPVNEWSLPLLDVFLDLRAADWMVDAACQDLESGWWFPNHTYEDGSHQGPDSYRMARVICKTCPVKVECLNHALKNHERFGMWGGMSPRERELYRRRKRKEADAG